MIKLTAVVLTFNEAHNIGRCLQSLLPVADKIIVVDSYSTDATEAICKQFGVRFIQHRFEGYVEQKNYALSCCDAEHVISLDADEALDQTLTKSILEVKNNFTAAGYSMNRMTNYCGQWIRHGSWYPDKKLRLFRRSIAKWEGENPHDKLSLAEGSKVMHLKGDLLHYSYYTFAEHQLQTQKFSTIAAHSAFKQGRRAGFFDTNIRPLHKFIRDYFFYLGFLDGKAGYTIACQSALGTKLKYMKLKELCKKELS
ncbi:MAG: lipopolysaccharide core biosynthesis glycosyl transferase [Bacteroidota bacterium]|jgi:glycosyltransferase involved in cell wall biosynthesis